MTTAYYLIPGAMLPEHAARETLASLPGAVRAGLERIGAGRETPAFQWLSEPLHEYSPHRAWLWKVLTHRRGAPVTAPYLWIADGGPKLDLEFWALSPWRIDEGGRFAPLALPEEALPAAACALERVFTSRGLRLTISGTRLFVTSRRALDLDARPVRDLCGMDASHVPHLPHLMRGKDAQLAAEALEEARAALRGALSGRPEAEALGGLWLSGGGFAEPVFPPSTFRSVVSDDPVTLAWAEISGIPRSALGALRGRSAWPAAPEGDRIVVLQDLYGPWLAGDFRAWAAALPSLIERLEAWRALEKAAKIDESAVVLFGRGGASTLMPEKRGALSFFRRPAQQPPESWLVDPGPRAAQASGEEASR